MHTRKLIFNAALFLYFLCSFITSSAQYVGFGESSPNSKIDAVHAGTTGSTVEATQSHASNTAPAIIVKNSSGGEGMEIQMNTTTSTKSAIKITHLGKGSAIRATGSNSSIGSALAIGYFEYTGSESRDHVGVHGVNNGVVNYGFGVQGDGGYTGVLGTSDYYGVRGIGGTYGLYGSGTTYGLYALGTTSGIVGSGTTYGVYGTGTAYGVVGNGSTYGVYASGNLGASGTKTFIIDHPLDPENKYLRHFSIESNEVLNLYRGMVQLDDSGRATIVLPDYFESINIEFTYQLTPVGSPQQPWVVQEIEGNQFVVAGAARSKVSWTVMAQRNDAYMQAYPAGAESFKEAENQGKYLRPELYQHAATEGIFSIQQPSDSRQTHTTAKP